MLREFLGPAAAGGLFLEVASGTGQVTLRCHPCPMHACCSGGVTDAWG